MQHLVYLVQTNYAFCLGPVAISGEIVAFKAAGWVRTGHGDRVSDEEVSHATGADSGLAAIHHVNVWSVVRGNQADRTDLWHWPIVILIIKMQF